MKTVYEDFYKIHGCGNSACGTKSDKMCDALADRLCFEPSECNDCLLESVGLAQAVVPYQTDLDVMDAQCSLVHGTVFSKLVRPYKKDMSHMKMRRCNNE